MAFDPQYPPTSNSLNRLRLVRAAGIPDSLVNQTGYGLVSTLALNACIAQEAQAQGLSCPEDESERLDWFYAQIDYLPALVTTVAETLGARLGYLLLTLVASDVATHQANPDKDPAYWAYWSTVRTVYMGGGVMSGPVGELIAARAQAILRQHPDLADVVVATAVHPRHLPLLGAARTVTSGDQALILDFGSTFVKRARAHYSAEGLTQLQALSPIRSNFPDDAPAIFARMVEVIVQDAVPGDVIPISVAAYVDAQGQPLQTQHGIYMQLAQLTGNVPAALSQAVSERLRKPVQVRLLHDGTAAALFYAPLDHAAVLTIGTALGSGYPVARPHLNLRPVSPSLTFEIT